MMHGQKNIKLYIVLRANSHFSQNFENETKNVRYEFFYVKCFNYKFTIDVCVAYV